MFEPRDLEPILEIRFVGRAPKTLWRVPRHWALGPGVRSASRTSDIVKLKGPEVSSAKGTTTWARSAPAATKHDSGIDSVCHLPGGAFLNTRVTSSIAPADVPHLGSVQRRPILTTCVGACSTR